MSDSPISPEARAQQVFMRDNQLKTELKKVLAEKDHARAHEIVVELIANVADLKAATPNHSPLSASLDIVLAADIYAEHPVYADLVRLLLDAGAPVNPSFTQTATPLLAALRSGNADAAAMILDAGADFKRSEKLRTYQSGEAKPMLMWAIESGQTNAARRMIEGGATVHGSPTEPRPLQAAARMGDLEVARALIERGAEVNAQFASEKTPHPADEDYHPSGTALMEAARKEDNPVLPFLLEQGADVSALNEIGWSALHFAAMPNFFRGHGLAAHNADILLQKGADPNLIEQFGETPLLLALNGLAPYNEVVHREPVRRCVEVLLSRGADPNLVGQSTSALQKAANHRDVKIINLLLQTGANHRDVKVINISPQAGPPSVANASVLWMLALEGQGEEHQKLLSWLRENATPLAPESLTRELRTAVQSNDINRVKMLIAQGVPIRLSRPSTLYIACKHSSIEIVSELLRTGIDPNGSMTDQGTTTLMMAVRCIWKRRDVQIISDSDVQTRTEEDKVAEDLKIVRALVAAGAELEARDNYQMTVLHYAAWWSAPPITQFLLEAGADVHALNEWQRTPLHRSMKGRLYDKLKESPEISRLMYSQCRRSYDKSSYEELKRLIKWDEATAKLLIAAGADVNAKSGEGYSPLALACAFSLPSIAQMLIDAGAPADEETPDGTMFDIVLDSGRASRLIEKQGFDLSQFRWLKNQMIDAANGEIELEKAVPYAAPHFRFAFEQDVAILKILDNAIGEDDETS